jgi:[acyl-carrier-protein] S-malonyltransferase
MGKELAESSPAAHEVFARADEALGWAISSLCFDGPESELALTAHTQPAILTVSLAVLAAIEEAYPGLVPAHAAGHSLGEYSALVAAGALSLEDAVRVVHARGRAMQAAVPEGTGGMAAIMGGDAEAVRALCAAAAEGEVLEPVNFNAPGQTVVAGHATAIARAVGLAGTRNLKGVPLKVSAPFHSSLMQPAALAVEQALAGISVSEPRFPVVSNVDAAPNSDQGRIPGLLIRQVDHPVLWEQSVRRLVELGATHALEIGPGEVLARLSKRIAKTLPVLSVGGQEGLCHRHQPRAARDALAATFFPRRCTLAEIPSIVSNVLIAACKGPTWHGRGAHGSSGSHHAFCRCVWFLRLEGLDRLGQVIPAASEVCVAARQPLGLQVGTTAAFAAGGSFAAIWWVPPGARSTSNGY